MAAKHAPGLTTYLANPVVLLTVYATGVDAVNQPEQSGSAPLYDSPIQLKSTVANTTVLIGNVPETVQFSIDPVYPGCVPAEHNRAAGTA